MSQSDGFFARLVFRLVKIVQEENFEALKTIGVELGQLEPVESARLDKRTIRTSAVKDRNRIAARFTSEISRCTVPKGIIPCDAFVRTRLVCCKVALVGRRTKEQTVHCIPN